MLAGTQVGDVERVFGLLRADVEALFMTAPSVSLEAVDAELQAMGSLVAQQARRLPRGDRLLRASPGSGGGCPSHCRTRVLLALASVTHTGLDAAWVKSSGCRQAGGRGARLSAR